MSEEINKIYTEPIDIFKFFQFGHKEKLFDLIITEAERFYDKHGMSPIVQQEKFDGYMIDYFFLVRCLVKFMENNIRGDSLREKLKIRIERDFFEKENNDDFFRNGKLLVAILSYCDFILSPKQNRFLYTNLYYFNEDETKAMIFSSLVLNFKVSEEKDIKDILRRIGSKKKYKIYGLGIKKFESFLNKISAEGQKLFNFCKGTF